MAWRPAVVHDIAGTGRAVVDDEVAVALEVEGDAVGGRAEEGRASGADVEGSRRVLAEDERVLALG